MSEFSFLPGNRRACGHHRRCRSSLSPGGAVGRGLLVTALLTLGSLLWAPTASAHDELLDLQPGNKVVVSTPPTQVQLVFGAPAMPLGTQVRVTGPTGAMVSTGPASVDGGNVVQMLSGGLVDGVYRVDWRVTAADGHPVSGTYTFTLKAASTATSPAPAVSGSSAVVPTATSAPAASASSTSRPSASGSSASGGSASTESGPSTGLVVGLSLMAAAVAGAMFAFMRRRNGASTRNEGNETK
jgi:methionine-rich copper-binding protein CopC